MSYYAAHYFFVFKLSYVLGIEDDTFDDEVNEINATEVVEFDEHAKQIIDDRIVEVNRHKK